MGNNTPTLKIIDGGSEPNPNPNTIPDLKDPSTIADTVIAYWQGEDWRARQQALLEIKGLGKAAREAQEPERRAFLERVTRAFQDFADGKNEGEDGEKDWIIYYYVEKVWPDLEFIMAKDDKVPTLVTHTSDYLRVRLIGMFIERFRLVGIGYENSADIILKLTDGVN